MAMLSIFKVSGDPDELFAIQRSYADQTSEVEAGVAPSPTSASPGGRYAWSVTLDGRTTLWCSINPHQRGEPC
jgi:hypothetical protein